MVRNTKATQHLGDEDPWATQVDLQLADLEEAGDTVVNLQDMVGSLITGHKLQDMVAMAVVMVASLLMATKLDMVVSLLSSPGKTRQT